MSSQLVHSCTLPFIKALAGLVLRELWLDAVRTWNNKSWRKNISLFQSKHTLALASFHSKIALLLSPSCTLSLWDKLSVSIFRTFSAMTYDFVAQQSKDKVSRRSTTFSNLYKQHAKSHALASQASRYSSSASAPETGSCGKLPYPA